MSPLAATTTAAGPLYSTRPGDRKRQLTPLAFVRGGCVFCLMSGLLCLPVPLSILICTNSVYISLRLCVNLASSPLQHVYRLHSRRMEEEDEVGLTTPSLLGQRSREQTPNCPPPPNRQKCSEADFRGAHLFLQPNDNGRSLSLQIGVRRLWAKKGRRKVRFSPPTPTPLLPER